MANFRLKPDAIKEGRQWVGVLRRVPVPPQAMTIDETQAPLEDWRSQPCDTFDQALGLAKAELARRSRPN